MWVIFIIITLAILQQTKGFVPSKQQTNRLARSKRCAQRPKVESHLLALEKVVATCQSSELERALSNARLSIEEGKSPGAGLSSAEEQSAAAYADLINTSMQQRGINSLSLNETTSLERGGRMWEKNSLTEKNKLGLLGDVFSVLKAFVGGAHIEKNKFGET